MQEASQPSKNILNVDLIRDMNVMARVWQRLI
jgi:hypothetical protein